MGKLNILYVGNYNRKDYLDMLSKCREDFNFFFLEFASPQEVKSNYYKTYGTCIFWKDFRDAFDLLEKIKPTKVIFLFIETYNHVALNLACKAIKLPTFQLEHGLRADYLLNLSSGKSTPKTSSLQSQLLNFLKVLKGFKAKLRTRLFLLNSIRRFPEADAAFIKGFMEIRRKHSFLDTAVRIKSPKRQADFHISFSKNIFRTHQRYDVLPDQGKVFYIGVPYFDKLSAIVPAAPVKVVLLIDQPLAEHSLLGWTVQHRRAFNLALMEACSKNNFRLYVKPHPDQDVALWAQNQPQVELINDEELIALAPILPLVIGFYSTLLMPFAAFKHTAVLSYENHPIGRIDVSKSFVEAGVAHPVYSMQELEWALQHTEQLHQRQLPHKAKFIEDWMYKFDGKAGERLRDILLGDPL